MASPCPDLSAFLSLFWVAWEKGVNSRAVVKAAEEGSLLRDFIVRAFQKYNYKVWLPCPDEE